MTKNEAYIDLQKIVKSEVIKDEPMYKHTSFKIGGYADVFIKASSIETISKIQSYANIYRIPLTIIGNGSNLLVSDKGIEGIVLKIDIQTKEKENKLLKNKLENLKIDIQKLEFEEKNKDVIVKVGAGNKVAATSHLLMTMGISGMEELSGIPGTIGGALTMNAGAYGKEMKDIVLSTKCMDKNGNIIELSNDAQHFEYRNSIYKNREYIILETKLILKRKNKEDIQTKMKEYIEKRISSQPTNYPSAGSTFKRGDGFITAKVIDECGLKGYRIGDAEISEKHAGFIINKGKATAQNVTDLIKHVKETVYKKTGLKIEEEIEFIGRK